MKRKLRQTNSLLTTLHSLGEAGEFAFSFFWGAFGNCINAVREKNSAEIDLFALSLETQEKEDASANRVEDDAEEKGAAAPSRKKAEAFQPIVFDNVRGIPLFKALRVSENRVGSLHEQDGAYHLTNYYAAVHLLGEPTLDPSHHPFLLSRLCDAGQLYLEQALSYLCNKKRGMRRDDLGHRLAELLHHIGEGDERFNLFVRYFGDGLVDRYPAVHRERLPHHPAVCEVEGRVFDRDLVSTLVEGPVQLGARLFGCEARSKKVPALDQKSSKARVSRFAKEKQKYQQMLEGVRRNSDAEIALRHILLYLDRLDHSLDLFNEHQGQLYLAFHVHNINTSATSLMEQLGYLRTIISGLPEKHHRLHLYFPELRDNALLLRANLGKCSSYPHFNNDGEGSRDLLETFAISLNAILAGDGFFPKGVKKSLKQLYTDYGVQSNRFLSLVKNQVLNKPQFRDLF